MIDNCVINLIRDYLGSRVLNPSLALLTHVKRLAIRIGSWWRINPLRRALIDSAIAYMRLGFVIRSLKLLAMLRETIIEALMFIVSRKTSFIAYVVGSKLSQGTRRIINPVIIGLQWLNKPVQYRCVPQ
ncbi:MAG: hypothetical protein ACP5NQ_08535 [Vulcanisaeta sp.]